MIELGEEIRGPHIYIIYLFGIQRPLICFLKIHHIRQGNQCDDEQ